MAKEENRTSHSDAISVTVLLSGNAAHPQTITAAAAAMTRAMVTSNLRLKGPPAAVVWESWIAFVCEGGWVWHTVLAAGTHPHPRN